jgi:hypothetical protein
MANYKLILDEDFRDEFTLIAIHCSVEAFKMAYLLNNHLHLKLKRKRVDLDFSKDGLEITFPWFEYEDEIDYISYDLIANKCKTERARTVASGGLFGNTKADEIITEYLLPEVRKVDFLLKITSEDHLAPVRKLILRVNEINEVISAYELEPDQLKSKNNLIFD